MAEASRSFGSAARRGALAVGLAQLAKMLVQFGSVIAMARLLAPEDFGLVASVAPLVAFVGLFQDLGMQQAVVQRESLTKGQINRIFWLTAAMGLFCAAAVVALGPLVARFYGDARLASLAAALAAALWLGGLAAVPMSLLNRRMGFMALACIEVVGAVLGFAAAVLGATRGLGYWSLALSPTMAALTHFLGALAATGWRPGRPRFGLDRDILGFGANVTGYNLANFFARNLDNILIGRVQGSLELGYYDRAYKLLMFPLQNLNAPLTKVMLPVLSRIRDDRPRFRETYLKTSGLLTLAAVPGVAALVAVPEAAVRFCFGEKWLPVAPIFAWLGLAGLLQPLNNSTGWIFLAQGRTRAMFRWGLFGATTTIAAILAGLPFGAVGVAATYAVTDYLVRLPVLLWFVGRVGPVRARDLLAIQLPLLAAAAGTKATADLWLVARLDLAGLPLLAATVAVSYGLAVLLTAAHRRGRRRLREAFALVGRLFVRRGRTPEAAPGEAVG